jgi:hypothetical protein
VHRDGVPVAVAEGGIVRELAPLDEAASVEVARLLKARVVAWPTIGPEGAALAGAPVAAHQ